MVERLEAHTRNDVVEVLVESFWDYPVMKFVLRDSSAEYPRHLRAVVGYYTDLRFARGGPVLGTRADGELAAVTLIDVPGGSLSSETKATLGAELRRVIGDSAWNRLETFEAASKKLEPTYPHHFVGMIGVRPEHQGKGLSTLLMDEVTRMSKADPESVAVCLSTEAPSNLPFYAKLGFEITGETSVDTLHTWFLAKQTT